MAFYTYRFVRVVLQCENGLSHFGTIPIHTLPVISACNKATQVALLHILCSVREQTDGELEARADHDDTDAPIGVLKHFS